MSHDPLADLNSTRQQIRDGRADAAQRLRGCLDIAQAPACDRVFLHTMFDAARKAATDPHARWLPLAGLAGSVWAAADMGALQHKSRPSSMIS